MFIEMDTDFAVASVIVGVFFVAMVLTGVGYLFFSVLF